MCDLSCNVACVLWSCSAHTQFSQPIPQSAVTPPCPVLTQLYNSTCTSHVKMILCAGRGENVACKSSAFITPLLSGFECWYRLFTPGLSLHIWTSSQMTCCQPPSQGIVSKPTPIEKPSLSRISVGYLHLQQSTLKLSTGWFETRGNDRRRDLSYPKVVLYLMRQGLHLESIIFRYPVHLPGRGDSVSKFFILDPQIETLN